MEALYFVAGVIGYVMLELFSIQTPIGLTLGNILFSLCIISMIIGFIARLANTQLMQGANKALKSDSKGDKIRKVR